MKNTAKMTAISATTAAIATPIMRPVNGCLGRGGGILVDSICRLDVCAAGVCGESTESVARTGGELVVGVARTCGELVVGVARTCGELVVGVARTGGRQKELGHGVLLKNCTSATLIAAFVKLSKKNSFSVGCRVRVAFWAVLHGTLVSFTSSVNGPLLKSDDEYRMTFVLSFPGQVRRDNSTRAIEVKFIVDNAKAMVTLSSLPFTLNNVVKSPSTRALGPAMLVLQTVSPLALLSILLQPPLPCSPGGSVCWKTVTALPTKL